MLLGFMEIPCLALQWWWRDCLATVQVALFIVLLLANNIIHLFSEWNARDEVGGVFMLNWSCFAILC